MSLTKDRTQETSHLANLKAIALTLDALANKWSHLHMYYKLSGHYLQIVFFKVKKKINILESLAHKYTQNVSQNNISFSISPHIPR